MAAQKTPLGAANGRPYDPANAAKRSRLRVALSCDPCSFLSEALNGSAGVGGGGSEDDRRRKVKRDGQDTR